MISIKAAIIGVIILAGAMLIESDAPRQLTNAAILVALVCFVVAAVAYRQPPAHKPIRRRRRRRKSSTNRSNAQ